MFLETDYKEIPMTERNDIRRQIAALEEELDRREGKASRKANDSDPLVDAFRKLEAAVKAACGESFMDDVDTEEILEALPDEEVPGDDMDEMSYMDMDDDMDDDMAYMEYMSEDSEDQIDQDYLDDVVKEEKNPADVTTNDSMLDAAPTGYVARLMSASRRLDRVADELEKQGNKKMAFRIDKIADAIDARIAEEAE